MTRRAAKGGQRVGYPVAPRPQFKSFLVITLAPCVDTTLCTVSRRGGPTDGPHGTTLATCYVDVSRTDLAGLSTRAVVVLLSAALAGHIPAVDWHGGGWHLGPPQIVYQDDLDFD